MKKIDHENPEHVSTTWIARKHTISTRTVRNQIHAGQLKAEMLSGSDTFMIKFESYLEWKARYFKPYKPMAG